MILAIVLLSGLVLGLGYGCFNLLKQVEQLEENVSQIEDLYQTKIQSLRDQILRTEIKLKEIDIRGAFESDDEVGTVFESIRQVHSELTEFIESIYDTRD